MMYYAIHTDLFLVQAKEHILKGFLVCFLNSNR